MVDAPTHAAQSTGAGVMTFLDFAMEKGYLKVPTGQSMKTACKEVLSATSGNDWEQTDLSSLDIDDTVRRFETLRAMKFSTGSLNTYKGRFKKSLAMFEEFRTNPGSWRPDIKPRSRVSKAPDKIAEDAASTVTPSGSSLQPIRSAANMITYPFPLRDGVLVSLQLPADLTRREAKRLSAFVDSLAVEEQPALPPAHAELSAGALS